MASAEAGGRNSRGADMEPVPDLHRRRKRPTQTPVYPNPPPCPPTIAVPVATDPNTGRICSCHYFVTDAGGRTLYLSLIFSPRSAYGTTQTLM
jgi:hypothetical protein